MIINLGFSYGCTSFFPGPLPLSVMPISIPVIMVLTERKPNSHDHRGIIAILLHGELGCPLSYLVAGSEVINVEVSVTDIYGMAIARDQFLEAWVETRKARRCDSRKLRNGHARQQYLKDPQLWLHFRTIGWQSMLRKTNRIMLQGRLRLLSGRHASPLRRAYLRHRDP
jgi:hypothetical protein